MDVDEICKICDALSNPTRIKILSILNKKPMTIYDLSKYLKLSRPVLYAHMKKLENANLVKSETILEEGRAKRYYITKKFKLYIDNEVIDSLFK